MSSNPIVRFILDGNQIIFDGADILECSISMKSDPIGATLPVSTASVSIFTTDPKFSIYSDGTYFQALAKFLPIDIEVGTDEIKSGRRRFYLDKWRMESENILVFELVDALGVCVAISYPGSLWEEETPVRTVLDDIAKYTPFNIHLDVQVVSRTVRGWIPPSTVRDALQQVCFAARATAKPSELGTITIFNAELPAQLSPETPYPTITNSEKSINQEVTLLPKITDIELVSHDYYKLAESEQAIEEVYSAWLEPGNYVIAFQKPYWKVWGEGAGSYPIYTATEDGRVITTEDSVGVWGDATVRIAAESETYVYGSNHISVRVDVAGQITLWGYPLFSADRSHKYHEAADAVNEILIENAMLVTPTNASAVLEKVIEYCTLRYQKKITLFPKVIEVGSIWSIDTFRDKKISGIAEQLEIDLAGGWLTDATFRGLESLEVSGGIE